MLSGVCWWRRPATLIGVIQRLRIWSGIWLLRRLRAGLLRGLCTGILRRRLCPSLLWRICPGILRLRISKSVPSGLCLLWRPPLLWRLASWLASLPVKQIQPVLPLCSTSRHQLAVVELNRNAKLVPRFIRGQRYGRGLHGVYCRNKQTDRIRSSLSSEPRESGSTSQIPRTSPGVR